MENGWKEVFLTPHEYQAIIARDILENAGLNVVILNLRDSSYLAFGEFSVIVPEEAEDVAIDLLKELKH
jgi:hypothetical protein